MMDPTRFLGLSEAYGSWKIICISRRRGRISRFPSPAISWPSKRTDPEVGSISWRIVRERVDLPQPDSPTRPKVEPCGISKVTPSSARTWPTVRSSKTPDLIGKCLTRSVTSRSGAPLFMLSRPPSSAAGRSRRIPECGARPSFPSVASSGLCGRRRRVARGAAPSSTWRTREGIEPGSDIRLAVRSAKAAALRSA